MIEVDSPTTVRQWFEEEKSRLAARSIATELRLPKDLDENKATVTLETDSHVGSVTAWGAGTLEFIVLDVSTKQEVIMSDREFMSRQELRELLTECAKSFSEIAGSG